jgi:hypothetical protein
VLPAPVSEDVAESTPTPAGTFVINAGEPS